MVKKHVLVAAALCALAVPSHAQTLHAELDGRPLNFQQPPVMAGGSVLVPLRGTFEQLGADVRYDGATQTIRATRGERVVQLTLGSSTATVDGRAVRLESAARTIGDTTMVPLRFVSEALGAQVRWIAATSTVIIESAQAVLPPSETFHQAAPPTITSLIHNARGALQVGDHLVVTMTGDPGGSATFEILGHESPIPMREVTAGSYQGEVVVSRDMRVRHGTLLAHLRRDGQEAAKEAERPVTVGEGETALFDLHPMPGSVEDNPRTALRIRPEGQITPHSLRLSLDGMDVTPYAQWRGNEFVFQPTQELVPGLHQANVSGFDPSGRPLSQTWDFSVRPRQSAMDLTITNLRPGSYVPPIFDIQGQTEPYATVSVTTVSGQPLNAGGNADASGRFDLRVDASWLAHNSQITLEIQARRRDGEMGPMRSLPVVLR